MARRFGVQLAQSCQAWVWESRAGFVGEARLVVQWYETGRKVSRPRMGIVRGRHDGPRIVGANCVITEAVRHHYARFLNSVRLDGLWN